MASSMPPAMALPPAPPAQRPPPKHKHPVGPVAEVRAAQVARALARLGAKEGAGGRCAGCGLLAAPPRSHCVCVLVTPLACRHAVTTVIHPCELVRASSTHRLLERGLRAARTCVWSTPRWPDVAAVWAGVLAQCAQSGQAPCFLYPSSSSIHVADFYAGLPPARRAAGLHLLVLDGTWSNARCIAKQLPELAARHAAGELGGPPPVAVHVVPRQPHTLFHPLRTQPSPGRVSTLEAVALVLDACRHVDLAARQQQQQQGGGSEEAVAPPPRPRGYDAPAHRIAAPLHLLTPAPPSPAQLAGAPAAAAPPPPPPVRCFAANRLRFYLMAQVDALMTQCGEVGPTSSDLGVAAPSKYRGVGYRSWVIGGAAPPLTPARYRRLIADAQTRPWWQRRAVEVGHTPGQGLTSTYFRGATSRGGNGGDGCGSGDGGSGDGVGGRCSGSGDGSGAPPSGVRSVRSAIIISTPLPDGPPSSYAGLFAGLPASLLVHIAEFVYGAAGAGDDSDGGGGGGGGEGGRIIPCGYTPRLGKSQTVQWAAFEARMLLAPRGGGPPLGEEGDGEGDDSGEEEGEDGEEGARSEGEGGTGGGSGGAAAPQLEAASGEGGGGHGPRQPAVCRLADLVPRNAAQLPPLGRHNTHALALTCRELLLLFSGRVGPASGWGLCLEH